MSGRSRSGDLHFDRLEHHDHEWLAREHPGDVSQVENYSRITRELTPRLFARVRESLADADRSKTNVPFVSSSATCSKGCAATKSWPPGKPAKESTLSARPSSRRRW